MEGRWVATGRDERQGGVTSRQVSDLRGAIVTRDVSVLEAGDLAPADGRLIDAFGLSTSEAPLTGESAVTNRTWCGEESRRFVRSETGVKWQVPCWRYFIR